MARRGKRTVVGYAISLSGMKGGPWYRRSRIRWVTPSRSAAERALEYVSLQPGRGNAEIITLVRYVLDPEEEKLRDELVDAIVQEVMYRTAYEKVSHLADGRTTDRELIFRIYSALTAHVHSEVTLEKARDAMMSFLRRKPGGT